MRRPLAVLSLTTSLLAFAGGADGGLAPAAPEGWGTAKKPRAPLAPRRGQVTLHQPLVNGAGVEPEKLAQFLRARKATFLACYEQSLQRDADFGLTTVVLRLGITPTGRPGDLVIETPLSQPLPEELVRCLRAITRGWVLPARPAATVPVQLGFDAMPLE